jgi:hypothetical protein
MLAYVVTLKTGMNTKDLEDRVLKARKQGKRCPYTKQ